MLNRLIAAWTHFQTNNSAHAWQTQCPIKQPDLMLHDIQETWEKGLICVEVFIFKQKNAKAQRSKPQHNILFTFQGT